VTAQQKGKIAFVSERDGNLEIYTVDAAGGNVTRLTSTSEYEGPPAFSPDGKRIVYYLFRNGISELRVMNADGTGDVKVMDAGGFGVGGGVCWSPNGKKFAYVTDKDGNLEIYTANMDGNEQRNLTQHSALDMSPAWWAAK
jgi:TolB protein